MTTKPQPQFNPNGGIDPNYQSQSFGMSDDVKEGMKARIGITDLTNAVDTKSKAVLATEEAAACGMRIEMLRGQLMAEQDRFIELHNRAQAELDAELKRVTGGGS